MIIDIHNLYLALISGEKKKFAYVEKKNVGLSTSGNWTHASLLS